MNSRHLFNDPSSNPLGSSGAAQLVTIRGTYEAWRTDAAPLTAAALHEKVLRQFKGSPIGGVGVFVTQQSKVHFAQQAGWWHGPLGRQMAGWGMGQWLPAAVVGVCVHAAPVAPGFGVFGPGPGWAG